MSSVRSVGGPDAAMAQARRRQAGLGTGKLSSGQIAARSADQYTGPGTQAAGGRQQLPGGLALPQGAAAQGRGLPPGGRHLRHEEGLRGQRPPARLETLTTLDAAKNASRSREQPYDETPGGCRSAACSCRGGAAFADAVPELFQKVKEQVKAGSWNDALVTMEVLDIEAAKPANQQFQSQLEAPLAFYRGVCEANVDQAAKASADFETFLAAAAERVDRRQGVLEEGGGGVRGGAEVDRVGGAVARCARTRTSRRRRPSKRAGDGGVDRGAGRVADDRRREGRLGGADDRRGARGVRATSSGSRGTPEDDHSFRPTFDKRVAFADANFTQKDKSEKRGSMTDRGMVFVLMGPPTYGGRRRLKAGEDKAQNAGMSSVGDHDSYIAQKQAVAAGPGGQGLDQPAGGHQRSVHRTRAPRRPKPTTTSRRSGTTARSCCPRAWATCRWTPIFITKKGYGMFVLQRDSDILTTLGAAKKKPE